MNRFEPITEELIRLQKHLSASCWEKRVEAALARLEIIESLREHCPEGTLTRGAVREVDAGLPWANAQRWWTWYDEREGEHWERMMDRRLPPTPWKTPEAWATLIQGLGRMDPPPSCEEIRQALVGQFGPKAGLSDATIRRILKEAGLWIPYSSRRNPREKVTELNGGGALVPLLAAELETGTAEAMSSELVSLAQSQEPLAKPVEAEPEGRDERGRFTGEYNQNRLHWLEERGYGFYRSTEEIRAEKDLGRLRLASLSAATVTNHLRAILGIPLLTQRRGTVGMDGPSGAWLSIVSPVAYRAATINKTLSELKVLQASEMMWDEHGRRWCKLSDRWSEGQGWRQLVDYVDVTYDPWWTARYAESGKVSRTGRVQPCLSRTLLTSGPGVPIIAHVASGTTSLSKNLLTVVNYAAELRGEDPVGRITIVDGECCTIELLQHFTKDPDRDFITVVKGPLAEGKVLEEVGDWQRFRSHDQLREAVLNLVLNKEERLAVRIVEMERRDSRHPKPTWFATTAGGEQMSTTDVAEAYLSRWPNQEDLFRRGRQGAGLERSQGFGVSQVTHVAVIGKREKAGRRLERAQKEVEEVQAAEQKTAEQLESSKERLKERKRAGDENLDGRSKLGVRQAQKRLKGKRSRLKQADRKLKKATKEFENLASMPDTIYTRDTSLESVATLFKMWLLALLEFICQEYLGKRRIMPRTFIESWMPLPVTIRERRDRVIYEVASNPRDEEMTALLREVLDEITRRKLKKNGKLMIARVRDGP